MGNFHNLEFECIDDWSYLSESAVGGSFSAVV
jgi:hypothetical protein